MQIYKKRQLFPIPEHNIVSQEKVHHPGHTHSRKTADENIPPCKSFNKKKSTKAQHKDAGAGNIICSISTEKESRTSFGSDIILPDIEIEYREVHHHSALEGNHRRKKVLSPVSFSEYKVRQEPEDKHIDTCTDYACP
jgi:hypothetical protein